MARHLRIGAARSCLLAGLALAVPAWATPDTSWNFSVLLDGRAIGTHRFELRPTGNETRSLQSDARFDVKILGFTVYRYRHEARETWEGNCLDQIEA